MSNRNRIDRPATRVLALFLGCLLFVSQPAVACVIACVLGNHHGSNHVTEMAGGHPHDESVPTCHPALTGNSTGARGISAPAVPAAPHSVDDVAAVVIVQIASAIDQLHSAVPPIDVPPPRRS